MTITAAVYLIVLGVGTGNWLVIWAGIALVVLAAATVVVPLYLRRRPRWIAGTGRVLSASLPPESGTVGAAELELIIATPGAPLVTVKVRDPRVPVEKWPELGGTLPVRVALDDPHSPRRTRSRPSRCRRRGSR